MRRMRIRADADDLLGGGAFGDRGDVHALGDLHRIAEDGGHVGRAGAVEEQWSSVVVGGLSQEASALGGHCPSVEGAVRRGYGVVGRVQVLPHVLTEANLLCGLQCVEVRARSVNQSHDGLVEGARDSARPLGDHLVVEGAEVALELVGERHDDRDGVRQHVLLTKADAALGFLRSFIDPRGLGVAGDDRHARAVAWKLHFGYELHERALVFRGLPDLRLGFWSEVEAIAFSGH